MDLKKSSIYLSREEGSDHREESRPWVGKGIHKGALAISGTIASKRGEPTYFTVDIAKSDFHRILRIMVDIDEDYFVKAVERAVALPDL